MIKEITSKENNKIKRASSLKESKYRKEYKEFLVEGKKCLETALKSGNVKEIFTVEEIKNIPSDITQYLVSYDLLKKLSSVKNPEGVIAVCNMVNRRPKRLNKVVYLDHVSDPGNVGTIIRTAYAFDYDAVVLSEGSCDPYNEKVVAASKGAIFGLPILFEDINELRKDKVVIVSALNEKAKDMEQVKIDKPFILVVGNEANGVSPELIKSSDVVTRIEIKNIDSLNVAIAAGILMNYFK